MSQHDADARHSPTPAEPSEPTQSPSNERGNTWGSWDHPGRTTSARSQLVDDSTYGQKFIRARAADPTTNARHLGFEVVDVDYTTPAQLGFEPVETYPLANGELVMFGANGEVEIDLWARPGDQYGLAGTMPRIHRPGVDTTALVEPSAYIHPSAHVGPGAMIGPNAHIGRYSWVGANATVAQNVEISEGVFIGRNAHLGRDSNIGNGAVIGTGAALGPRNVLGPGSSIEQNAYLEPGSRVAAGTNVPQQRSSDPYKTMQIANSVERLLSLDRD